MGDVNIIDKSMRSVFVGNIPYEATEEKLKDIFNEVGPVLSFKLVYDRETGKPKGYGFCEYKDQETALSAMRNLNGYEIGGRALRVDNACTEKSRLEMQSLLAGPPVDNTYGEAVESDKAPEVISKAVASLPPEQMFELMKQMKLCIQNNPAEGKAMLLQNPQLAYALLQAQVVMRIVDPQIAITMLHKSNPQVAPLVAPTESRPMPVQPPVTTVASVPSAVLPPQRQIDVNPVANDWGAPATRANTNHTMGHPPPVINTHVQQPAPFMGDMDMRSLDPRAAVAAQRNAAPQDQDLRIPPMVPAPQPQIPPFQPDHGTRDPRYIRDPRTAPPNIPRGVSQPVPPPRPVAPPVSVPVNTPSLTGAIPTGASDQEKAALIMQVLQLSDEQIAMLPPEQRQSIIVLKEQIAKSTQR
ncbi:cleavage stimulation factor subunit 2 isoform X2 [Cimex lectularius]|uniref:RRM domain-containing protein n=1 Tax=Cimex lectularius TaxID=79782 RepID=A0A8I6R6I7_CIMLE|nr:cleavage stimulation factor subunit 2 isoform X2 [Cimex lectularius]